MTRAPRIEPLGEGASRVTIEVACDRRELLGALRAIDGVTDAVVTERHACVHYDPRAEPRALAAAIAQAFARAEERATWRAQPTDPVVIRARYDGEDLDRVAEFARLTRDEVAAAHCGRDYVVRVVGFMPGFAYLGDVDARIAAPRLPAPRARVPAGAIGIAGARTGVYPFASPGGWNLVATAVDFVAFDPARGAALALGDRVRFERVP